LWNSVAEQSPDHAIVEPHPVFVLPSCEVLCRGLDGGCHPHKILRMDQPCDAGGILLYFFGGDPVDFSDGFAGNVLIQYSSTGIAGTYQTLSANEANDGNYTWNILLGTYNVSDQYVIRITSISTPAILDRSDAVFSVIPPISNYYVNDGSTVNDVFTTAIGNDANDAPRNWLDEIGPKVVEPLGTHLVGACKVTVIIPNVKIILKIYKF
jgi:hypothetical protein